MGNIVAIVGRPNVGKSTLFNRLTGTRQAIVNEEAGTTRDRQYGKVEWTGKEFSLIDTGGWVVNSEDVFEEEINKQVKVAIEEADVILFVVDVLNGITDLDMEVAQILRRCKRPVIVVANKADNYELHPASAEFYSFGLGDPFCISAINGSYTGDLLDKIVATLPEEKVEILEEELPRIAIIGRPNAGKSSLINAFIGEDRHIVTDIAGTTRDATDSYVENKYGKFVFIDTAGLRRKSRVYDSIEKYSVIRARMAVERAQVCVIMIDAVEGFTEQDSKVAGIAHELGKACIIAVNKWDAVEKDGKTMDSYRKKLMNDFSFMSYAPIIFISAKTGLRLDRLFELIKYVDDQNAMRISTGRLNDLLADATARVQPPTDKGRRLKIFYMTQASTRPPTFVCFVNRKDLFHYSYQRYIDNQIRSVFGLEGTPTRMIIRERESNKK